MGAGKKPGKNPAKNPDPLPTTNSLHFSKLVAEGWSATQLVTQLYDKIVIGDEAVGDYQKSKIVLCCSETDKRLIDGSDEHLTILDLCLQVAGIIGGR